MTHWTDTYVSHADVIYEVDADIYQDSNLTRSEMGMVDRLLDDMNRCLSSPILDLACGVGRHSIEIAGRGYRVTGVDHSINFLKIAKRKAGSLPVSFERGDVRSLRFRSEFFSTVTLLGNSFGFFEDMGNLAVLQEVYRVLSDSGVFVFDVTDKDVFLKTLKPYTVYQVQTPSFGLVKDERWRDWDGKAHTLRCRKKHTTNMGVLLDTTYSLRLYGRNEMLEILDQIGFRQILCRPYQGGRLGAMSSRLFFLAVK